MLHGDHLGAAERVGDRQHERRPPIARKIDQRPEPPFGGAPCPLRRTALAIVLALLRALRAGGQRRRHREAEAPRRPLGDLMLAGETGVEKEASATLDQEVRSPARSKAGMPLRTKEHAPRVSGARSRPDVD
jgi:hypothetical protein